MERGEYGSHIIIDARGCENLKMLISREELTAFGESLLMLADLAPASNIIYSAFPERDDTNTLLLRHFHGDANDFGGYSAVQILATSHWSIHTYPAIKAVSFDIFSCEVLNAEEIANFVHDWLKPTGTFNVRVNQRSFS